MNASLANESLANTTGLVATTVWMESEVDPECGFHVTYKTATLVAMAAAWCAIATALLQLVVVCLLLRTNSQLHGIVSRLQAELLSEGRGGLLRDGTSTAGCGGGGGEESDCNGGHNTTQRKKKKKPHKKKKKKASGSSGSETSDANDDISSL